MTDLVPSSPSDREPIPPSSVPAAPTVAPGWYPDPNVPGMQRWWTGTGWGEQTAPLPPQAQPTAAAPTVAGPTTVVVNAKRPVNHLLHFILTVCTLGLWLPVWIIVAIAA